MPRSAWGVAVDVSFHWTPFGSSLAYGTVEVASAADEVPVPLALLLDAMETVLDVGESVDADDATAAGAAMA